MTAARDVAEALATALDREDWEAARGLLSPTCIYDGPDERLAGVEAIIASYRGNADRARAALDEIRYEHEVVVASDSAATILYIDHVRIGDERHIHRCRQEVEVTDGLVSAIRHIALPGETERLTEFLVSQKVSLG